MPREDSLDLPWLVADIGGTNARFGLVQRAGGAAQQVRTLAVAGHATPSDAVRAYLDAACPGGVPRPRRAAFAVATPVRGDHVAFTNSRWSFSRSETQAELGWQALLLLNDFEALALSLPRLGAAQLRSASPLAKAEGTLAVVGPGTGLGVGAAVQTPHGWTAVAGEGGHATLAAADDTEDRLLAQVRREHGHVSAERLLSGIGLPVLHATLAGGALDTPAIVERALAGDPACTATIDAFCALLGTFAGNVALTFGASALYIGGGIVPRLGDRFFASRFHERFVAKGRFRAYLEAVPVAVITDTQAALAGAALAIEQNLAG